MWAEDGALHVLKVPTTLVQGENGVYHRFMGLTLGLIRGNMAVWRGVWLVGSAVLLEAARL